jgi:hypothetical protein
MPQKLTIEFPDDVYQALTKAAERTKQTPEQWLVDRLRAALLSAEKRAAQMAEMWRKVGGVDVSSPGVQSPKKENDDEEDE